MTQLEKLNTWIEKYEQVNGTPTMCEIKAQIALLLEEQAEVNKLALGGVMDSVCHFKPCIDEHNMKCTNGRKWKNCCNRQTEP